MTSHVEGSNASEASVRHDVHDVDNYKIDMYT